MARYEDFGLGDRVKHLTRAEEGVVSSIEEDGVHVTFDKPTPRGNPSVGIFDRNWFEIHPDLLSNLTVKAADADRKKARSNWASMGWADR